MYNTGADLTFGMGMHSKGSRQLVGRRILFISDMDMVMGMTGAGLFGSKPPILVTGGSGLLGRQVAAALAASGAEVAAPSHAAYDLSDDEAVHAMLAFYRPACIINCAAIRSPEICEADDARTRRLNVMLPQRLAAAGVPLLHLSTDYVFDGRCAPYETDARRCPLNAYGRQKAEAEAALEGLAHVVILRVPVLFGPTEDLAASAVTVLAQRLCAAKGHAVLIDDWAVRYPTFTPDVAQQILALVPGIGSRFQGIYHYSGEEPMTKFLMAMTLAPLCGCRPEQCRPDTRPPRVLRPYDCHLSVRRLRQSGCYVPPTPFRVALGQIFS